MKLVVLIGVLILCSGIAAASVSLGVSPGILNYRQVLKGGYAQRTITVSTSKEQPVITTIHFDDELKDWIRLEPNTTQFTISRAKPYELNVAIMPPATAENGNYSGIMHVRTQKLAQLGGAQFGSAVKADITVDINVEITGKEIKSCYAGGLEVRDSEQGFPIDLYASVSNDGNVFLTPLFEVFVWNQMQTNLLLTKSLEDQRVSPTLSKRFYFGIPNSLEPGQYWITVNVPDCGFSQKRTFDILNPGEISDQGELVAVNTEPWVNAGALVPIIGVFKNTGVRPEDVFLKLEIKKGDQLIKALETETIRVLEGESQEFKQYLLVKDAGRYEVSAVAHYNKKLTFQKGTIINVKPAPRKKPNYYIWGVYGIMVLIIVILVRRIVRSY